MLFHSIDFAIFLPIIFFLYWFVVNKTINSQNLLILVASYLFYGWWDWKFLFLILFSTLVDFLVGYKIYNEQKERRKKTLLWISIGVNIGLLGFFKYYNFFIENFIQAFSILGIKSNLSTLQLILPVGISFYTFQSLSYTIDIYKGRLKPTTDFVAFAAFISFFPQLVAGPIERASSLLPQFYKKRTFDYSKAVDGLRQMLWGLFKKVVIADNCAQIANPIFENSTHLNGSTLVIGALFFTFQIYADFSGYSDIAIGCARLFNFNLRQNFAYPYFSRDFAEVWRRWHISLTTWFRDYLFIPIVRLWKKHKWVKIPVIIFQFMVIGFWHGANWTFIAWGLIQAAYFMPTVLRKNKKSNTSVIAQGSMFPSLVETAKMMRVFFLIVLSMIFFRATSINHAFNYIKDIFSFSIFESPIITATTKIEFIITLVLIGFFFIMEWIGRENQYAIEKFGLGWKRSFRLLFYYSIIALIFCFNGISQEYIYFQF
ncbi:MAG: membrane-bound O-acyltransferase family protein [Crocinitomicaceae bacterium]|nr:membrane-bound O-acyltransferase family protein [Crocinitomicaceae bacterium]